MKKLKIIKSLPLLHNVHVQDKGVIIDFLNLNSKTFDSIQNLGSFIDEIKIENTIGIKGSLKYLLVDRSEFNGESPGEQHKVNENGVRDIFKMPYDLPDSFITTDEKYYIILSTVENHTCNPIQRCGSCDGSGRCSSCNARGFNICSSCDGTGKKEVSDGKYQNGNPKHKKIACYSCHGSGRKPCGVCNGSAKCFHCDGNGKVTCKRCNGSSTYQSYKTYSNSFIAKEKRFCFSDDENLKEIVASSKNKPAFEDELIEWETEDEILFDKREVAFKINHQSKELFDGIEEFAELTPSQKIGRVYSYFETVPITKINYLFEGEEFSIAIVGEDNLVYFETIPEKHSYSKNFVGRIFDFFSKEKRKIAFIYIASFIFNADKVIDESEIALFESFLNNMKLSHDKRNQLVGVLQKHLTIEDIKPHIKIVQSDLRALIFAWQCVLQDKQIVESEISAFNELAKLFNASETQIEEIKHKATQFGRLKEVEMIEEYFR